MKGRVSQGFTIIEVTLFLSITGLMVAGLMVGTSASINRQRYNDAVTSLQSDIQLLYSDATSVANTRPKGNCSVVSENGSYRVALSEASASDPAATSRGQSDCIILGKALIIDGSKKESYLYDVIGSQPSGTSASNELSSIISAHPTVYKASKQVFPLKWDTSMFAGVEASDGSVAHFQKGIAIYVVRSPSSGSVYTFAAPMAYNAFSWQNDDAPTWGIKGAGNASSSEIFSADKTRAVQIGVHPCGLVSDNSSVRLRIAGNASSASAVTILQQTGADNPAIVNIALRDSC